MVISKNFASYAALLLFLLLTTAASAAAPSYDIIDLGPLPRVADDVAVSLNASGQISYWVETAGGTAQAALWIHSRVQFLGSLAGCPNSIPHAVNDQGEVVGWVNTSANPVDSRSTTRAFVFRHGQMQALGTLGGRDSRALGINHKGQIVGSSDRADGMRHAFLFDGHTFTDLGTLPGGSFSQANAVNAAGHAAGVASRGPAVKHAVLWRDGRLTDLGTLPHGTASSAQAINAKDQVAGYSETPDGYHAFLVTQGRMQDLGTLGEEPSAACGMNDLGAVVGSSGVSASARHAFLWQKGRMADLNTRIAPDSGWTLIQAYAINNAGQIVCAGHRDREAAHVLLLTPHPGEFSHVLLPLSNASRKPIVVLANVSAIVGSAARLEPGQRPNPAQR